MGGVRNISLAVCAGVALLCGLSGTQREHSLSARLESVESLERAYRKTPTKVLLLELVQGYLDRHAVGQALRVLESAPPPLRGEPEVIHLEARVLLEMGLASRALVREQAALDRCLMLGRACSSNLVSSARYRLELYRALTERGVEDPIEHPEEGMRAIAPRAALVTNPLANPLTNATLRDRE